MKKILLVSTMATLFMASAAQASTSVVDGGQVNFYGSVNEVSCTISVDGQGSDASVYLSPISKNEIATADTLYKAKPFTIDVSNCTPAAEEGKTKTIGVTWVGGNLLGGSDKGYLANSVEVNGADNVQFGLASTAEGKSIIIPGSSTQESPVVTTITGSDGSAVSRFTYYVGYITSTPTEVTAGDVASYATYQISYD